MFKWVNETTELKRSIEALERSLTALRAEWQVQQAALEDMHRKNLNTIRSLRRLAELEDEQPDIEPDDPAQLQLGTYDELEAARKRYGG